MIGAKKFLLNLFGTKRRLDADKDIDEELRIHLEMSLQENLGKGLSLEEAQKKALYRFGDLAQIKEMCGEIHEGGIERGVSQDFFYCVRQLANTPLFSIAVILILAIGIGANITIFSIFKPVLLRELPYENPAKIVVLSETSPQLDNISVAYPNYLDWKNRNQVFEKIGAQRDQKFNLTGVTDPELLEGKAVSANLFSMLGIKPVLGRDFSSREEQCGSSVIILSHQLWQRRYEGDPEIVGKNLRLNDSDFTVIGVLPSEFKLFGNAGIFTPLKIKPEEATDRNAHRGIYVLAILKSEITLDQVRIEMDGLAKSLEQQHPETNPNDRVKVVTLYQHIIEPIRSMLFIQLGALALVLLVFSTLIANLLLEKSVKRKKAFAIRKALGVSRRRLFEQSVLEGIILACAGGLLGLVFVLIGHNQILSLLPDVFLRFNEITIDSKVFIFTFVASLLVGLSLGLAPGLHAFRLFSADTLKEVVPPLTPPAPNYIRNFLLGSQIALAVFLLFMSGLMIMNFLHLRNATLGFDPINVTAVQLSVSANENSERTMDFYQNILRNIQLLPQIQSAALASGLPMIQSAETSFTIDIHPELPVAEQPEATIYEISPQFHQSLNIPLLKGRYFREQDGSEEKPAVIIDENIAREYLHDDNPIGRHITLFGDKSPREIIGVVGHIRRYNPDDSSRLRFQMYTPISDFHSKDLFLVIRNVSGVDPTILTETVRDEISKTNGDQPVSSFKTMEQTLSDSLARERSIALLLGICALISTLLAIAGISSAMYHALISGKSGPSPDLEVRAVNNDRTRPVIKHGILMILAGATVGLGISLSVVRMLPSFFHSVPIADLISVIGISLIFIFGFLAACYASALNASKLSFIAK